MAVEKLSINSIPDEILRSMRPDHQDMLRRYIDKITTRDDRRFPGVGDIVKYREDLWSNFGEKYQDGEIQSLVVKFCGTFLGCLYNSES